MNEAGFESETNKKELSEELSARPLGGRGAPCQEGGLAKSVRPTSCAFLVAKEALDNFLSTGTNPNIRTTDRPGN